ncbi:MAG: sodium/proline symporter [Sphaerospermopsis sp. SIO1G2]|nr:sodium/proline symporter [Sphaerospermopsis sp. SIO1G2]
MNEQVWIAITFIIFLGLFTGVGIYSSTLKQNTTTDYLLASRNVNPWLTALSAMATGQSGLLFTGQIGFAYKIGISSLWLTIGWVIGDYLAWYFVFKRLREVSEKNASDTVSSFLSQNIKNHRVVAITSALIIILFLGSYAAAQLVAGSKAINAVFGWNYHLGIIVGAVIVLIYCFSGGIRASIWTDAVQAVIMLVSLLILLIVAVITCGGIGQLWQSLATIDPNLIDWNSSQQKWGFLPFFIGWIVAGFGVVGQPHIMVRAMAIDSAENINFARNLKTALGLLNSFAATGIGLAARVIIPDLMVSGDPELALPYLSLELLPVVLVGLMLAGLFSATISTADSQILSCSAALTQDVFPGMAKSYKFAKIGTLIVTAIILAIALAGSKNVFNLITFSWSALASGLGPLLLLKVWQRSVSLSVAMGMMGFGIAISIIWNLGLNLSGAIYEVLPGMAAGMAVYGIAQLRRGN